jgi:hypothetical protein
MQSVWRGKFIATRKFLIKEDFILESKKEALFIWVEVG